MGMNFRNLWEIFVIIVSFFLMLLLVYLFVDEDVKAIIKVAFYAILIIVSTAIALYLIHSTLSKIIFTKTHKIKYNIIPKSFVFLYIFTKGKNYSKMKLPTWTHARKDKAPDRRYSNNDIVCFYSYIIVDGCLLATRNVVDFIRFLSVLRHMGIKIELNDYEKSKRQKIMKNKIRIENNASVSHLVNRFKSYPNDFKEWYVSLLDKMGYECSEVSKLHNKGYDITYKHFGQRGIVKCKLSDPKNRIGLPALQKLVGANMAAKADEVVYVTTSDFTKDAISYASHCYVTLINGEDLINMSNRYSDNEEVEEDFTRYEITIDDLRRKVDFEVLSTILAKSNVKR